MKKNRLGERVETMEFGRSMESKALDKFLGKDDCPCDRHLSDFCARCRLTSEMSQVTMKQVIAGIDSVGLPVHLRTKLIYEIQKSAGLM